MISARIIEGSDSNLVELEKVGSVMNFSLWFRPNGQCRFEAERRWLRITLPVGNLKKFDDIANCGPKHVLAIYNWYEAKWPNGQHYLVFTTCFPQSLKRYRTKGLSLFEWLILQRQGFDPCRRYTH